MRRRDEAAWADPALLILGSLAEGPKHGYRIAQDIAARAEPVPGPGTLYAALSRLAERGLITALPGGARRRPYELTGQGRAVLQKRLAALSEFAETCRSRLAPATPAEAMPPELPAGHAARFRGLVGGLAAIVWEADARSGEFTFVSDRAEELLGYPTAQWLGDPEFWPSILHPEDRDEAVRFCTQATAEHDDYDFTYRALTRDGRTVWLHDVVHVVRAPDGAARELQGVLIDITAQKRREQACAILAEAGRVLAAPDPLPDKLAAAAGLAVGVLGDCALVLLRGDDGDHRPVAAAPAEVAATVSALGGALIPAEFEARLRAGRAFVVPEMTNRLIVPLRAGGGLVGVLVFFPGGGAARRYDDTDLTLAEDLGQRVATQVATERIEARQRQFQHIITELARAQSLHEVALALTAGLDDAFGASAQSFYVVDADHPQALHLVHAVGYPDDMLDQFRVLRFEDPVPIAEAARTGEPIWLRHRDDWQHRYPHLVEHIAITGNRAAATLPLRVHGQVLGVLAASFRTPRQFPPDECDFALTLVGQAAQALQRALDADRRRSIAEILQRSLLPAALPELPRVALAAHYLPAVTGTQAGGDWYDVQVLDEHRVAIVVGDVVGQGPRAAAVMGQLRSALAAYLLDGHDPAAALTRLNRFAHNIGIDGARASTAICLILDTSTGQLQWSHAGHPPPLVLGPGGARYLDTGAEAARGTVLGIPDGPPFTIGRAVLAPRSSVLLYTDGLVERRGEVLDDGLGRLATTATPQHGAPPAQLLSTVIDRLLDGAGPPDDIAVVAAQLRPAPLHRQLTATPGQLPLLRRCVQVWAASAELPADVVADLHLVVGEAVSNAIEHAYHDSTSPGEFTCRLDVTAPGGVQVEVRDHGTWRAPPTDPGFRGRGLTIIQALAEDVTIDTSGSGTRLRCTLPVRTPPTTPPSPRRTVRPRATSGPAELRVHRDPGGQLRLRLCGELDLTTIGPLRTTLFHQLAASGDASVILDTREVTYLPSAGVGLLLEVARACPGRLHLQIHPGSPTARILALTGLDQHLPRTAPHPQTPDGTGDDVLGLDGSG